MIFIKHRQRVGHMLRIRVLSLLVCSLSFGCAVKQHCVEIPPMGQVCKSVDAWVMGAYDIGYWDGVKDADMNYNQCIAERAVDLQFYEENLKEAQDE